MEKSWLPFEEGGIKQLDNTYSHGDFEQMLTNPVINNAMGCLFGSFIGDALGAYLQFSKEHFNKMLQNVMKMPGGGVFRLKEGQVTDDSELAFHLLQSLTTLSLNKKFNDQRDNLIFTISKQYLSWYQSKPFDIGITCRNSLSEIKRAHSLNQNLPVSSLIQQMLSEVKQVSEKSESNGSLMRIAPVPFIFSLINKGGNGQQPTNYLNKEIQLTMQSMETFISMQTRLLHPNQNNVMATLMWSKLIIALIKRNSDSEIPVISKNVKKHFEKYIPSWGHFLSDRHQIKATQNIGWSKIAISLGFDVLDKITTKNQINEQTYNQMIFHVLSKGGDTDTNAAIVGGMIGAIVGFNKLPHKYLKKLLQLRHNNIGQKGRSRPTFYEPRQAFVNAYKIIKMATNE